jgi:hypothetical protein
MEIRKFGPAVIIGLGGTGQNALVRIKKLFLQNCRQVPPCIRLLAIETDGAQPDVALPDGTLVRLDQNEFCHLTIENIGKARQDELVVPWWTPYDRINN